MSILFSTLGLVMMLQLLQKVDAAYLNASPIRQANRHGNYGKRHREHGCRIGLGENPCKSISCLNGGTCTTNSEGIASCICVEGFFGQDCRINPCQSLTCINGGTCTTNSEGIASCICVEGFVGHDCRFTDLCRSLTCLNGGTCTTNSAGIASCICAEGFAGKDCRFFECDNRGYLYMNEIGYCIKLYNDTQTRDAAQSRCAADNANLVVFDYQVKELPYTNYILEQTGDYTTFWIGAIWLSGQDSASIWRWLNGRLLQTTYQNWAPGEPSTLFGAFTCAISSVISTDHKYTWSAEMCDSVHASLCEYPSDKKK